ncbi:Ribosomal RNA small subunit methyltransferase H [Acaryochloris thomasi RCC1774]|uniref:Ribosomal RNA small subunit methyltransferase H n=1 Tax=Acaryochloris thomasi RCC1774 TaxID=1764569 RepID=A0A2W1JVL4_9CYAN|nr:16S rRNA (cytosine(1402)-N(4))-methyltransferase RsmH [Acaryochloris thomasi]PZD72791.1 Ribosomal RNA small subunit methyltransferase H [Acaryochloris thomasi RCC1774]
MTHASTYHIPVLSQELLQGLELREGHYLDATVGGGGHSSLLLSALPTLQITALDRDSHALAAAREALAPFLDRVQFQQENFAEYDPGTTRFDGIIADFGVSSAQLDHPERGFSFRYDAPLDMRMDQRQDLTAADIINTRSEKTLADLFFHYGEERFSRRIARQVVAKRPFRTTGELADAIARAMPKPKQSRRHRIHPATRVFQALRIAVNEELNSIETFVQQAPTWLKPEGIIGMISFHSLEDRIVKHQLRAVPHLKILTKKPIVATREEIRENPRARSAKLRLAQRIPIDPLGADESDNAPL